MQFYTIVKRRDDPRLASFYQFCQRNDADNILVFCRPEHVSPDPSLWEEKAKDLAQLRAEEEEAGRTRKYDDAKALKFRADQKEAELKALGDQASDWLSDGKPPIEKWGWAVVENRQWSLEWTNAAFLSQVPVWEKHGVNGVKFTSPLANRIFVPLEQFDKIIITGEGQTIPRLMKVKEAENAQVNNKPATVSTTVETAVLTPEQIRMLSILNNELEKKFLHAYLGMDNGGFGREVKEVAALTGMSQNAVRGIMANVRKTFDTNGMSLTFIHTASLRDTSAPDDV